MKPNWTTGDEVTMSESDSVFNAGEPLIVCGPPGEYLQKRTGQTSTRKGHTVLARPHNTNKDSGHYWVRDELIIPTVTQEDVDEAIQSILHTRYDDYPSHGLAGVPQKALDAARDSLMESLKYEGLEGGLGTDEWESIAHAVLMAGLKEM